jgi:glycosyltransferase 2 family protein
MTSVSTAPSIITKKWLWRLATIIIALLIISLIVSVIDWNVFFTTLSHLSPLSILIVAGIYLLLNLFRCLRYKALLGRPDLPLSLFFPIGLYHNFLVRILPFKLGEVWYVVLIRRYFGLSVEEGVGSLFASRMLELFIIVLVGSAALLTSGSVLEGQSTLQMLFIIVIFGAGIPGLYFAGLILRAIAGLMTRIPIAFVQRVAPMVQKLAAEFDRLRHPRVFLGGLFWSFFTYGCSFAANGILLAATGIQLQPAKLILAVTLGMFASAFPFNIAGFGMVEVSWTFALTTLLGLSVGEAASTGLLLNSFQIMTSIVYGIIAYLMLEVMGKAKLKNEEEVVAL